MLTPIELIKATLDGMMQAWLGRIVNITSRSVKAPIDIRASATARVQASPGSSPAWRTTIRHGVTINNLLPGPFETDRLRGTDQGTAFGRRQSQLRGGIRGGTKANPPGRFGTAEEFGKMCAFLCSADAGYMTGQNILMDGGQYPGHLLVDQV